MTSTNEPLWVESKYGPAVALRDGSGKTYHVCHVSHMTYAHILIYDPDRSFEHVSSAELGSASPLFARIAEVDRIGGFLWDVPAYRSLCADVGFNPDRERPIYKSEDVDIVLRLRDAVKDARREGYKVSEVTFGALELLRTNERPEIRVFERCQAILQDWKFRRPKTLFEEAMERVDIDRMGSSTPICVEITFLPSWEGTGFTSTISLWTSDCESDGWSKGYGHLQGVALRPSYADKMTDLAVRRLIGQGVVFMSADEARTYMDSEGAYWSAHQGVTMCPRGFAPRRPTVAETLAWRFRRPETPLFDRCHPRRAA